jgi:spermidine synthase
VVVVENEDQFTFFADGIPVITTPVPDITFVEEFVHFPLLAHPNPEKVLVIGGGAGGLINEILKYKTIQKIDYVEIDPLLLKTVSRFSTPLTRKELGSQSVKIHYTDGKIFLKKSKEIYDAIFIGLPPPYTLQTNRFYTQEFFSLAKSMLNDKGMIVLTMPGSLAYYNSELKELNVSIFQTLKSVYPYVFILPGDFNLFIASPSSNFKNISPADIFDSLTSRNIDTKLITQPHIDYRFELKIRDWFFSTIGDTERIETIPLKRYEIVRVGYIPIAVSKFTANRKLAQKFIDFVLSEEGKKIFKKYHYFMSPDEAYEWIGQKKPVGGEYEVPKNWLKR